MTTSGNYLLNHINQLILDSVAEGIYGIDRNAKVIFWNKSAELLTGYQIQDFEQSNLHDLIHHTNAQGEHIHLHSCPVYHALNSGDSIFVKDDVFWHKNGTSFPVEYTVKPLLENKVPIGSVITFRDMTEKRKTEDMLLQWEKVSVLGQLAAGMAHEIRNPITTLKGFLKLMHTNQSFNNDYYTIMDAEFNRIESIIQELLTFSKPQETQYQLLDLNELLQQVVLLMEPHALFENIDLQLVGSPQPVIVHCIDYQIKQVVINLIKNGIEAMSGSGKLMVELTQSGDYAKIRVTDEGVGIPPELLNKLGEPFYSTKEKGTGLGLMVTYNVIRNNHQGSITADSEVNKGTTFTIKLPLSKTDV